MDRCFVLNCDYMLLNTIHWKRAIALLMKEKVEVLKYGTRVIKVANGSEIKVPLIIRLIKMIRMIYRNKVPLSKKNILIRDKYTCAYCGSKTSLTIDHVLPVSKGGKTTFENCVAACRKCNSEKGNRTPSQANMSLKRRPVAPTISEFLRIKMNQLGLDKLLQEEGIFEEII